MKAEGGRRKSLMQVDEVEECRIAEEAVKVGDGRSARAHAAEEAKGGEALRSGSATTSIRKEYQTAGAEGVKSCTRALAIRSELTCCSSSLSLVVIARPMLSLAAELCSGP